MELLAVHDDYCDQLDVDLFVSTAAKCCTDKDPAKGYRARSVLLRESIGRRLFPPESDQLQEWERLRKEVSVPLTKYYSRQYRELLSDDCYHREALERREVKKYLEEKAVSRTALRWTFFIISIAERLYSLLNIGLPNTGDELIDQRKAVLYLLFFLKEAIDIFVNLQHYNSYGASSYLTANSTKPFICNVLVLLKL
ncbi:uncharacterized protein Pyn_13739 [Prunus yedoensis var. nudiflora]|uniref:Uncharacterized protein n=1 Tax=Prunus yedoensis var. nudiflora TaxID=2094558 RepID=A0A314YPN1_PRUYE|nr:uncharacterized protein Pyn_13739 [Prunus yedoensis var. nudiflora]